MIENQIRREDIAYRMCKALEVRGNTPTLQLDTSVIPVVLVADLARGNEQDYATNRWCRGYGSTPAGANYGKLSFNNHSDSGIIVKVYQIDLFHSVGGVVGITIESSFATGTQINFTKSYTDSRNKQGNPGPPKTPTVDLRFDNSAGLGGHFMRPYVPAPPAIGYHVDMGGLVLRPGTRLHFEALDLAVEYSCAVEWTETNA